jgi:polyphosphate kinase
MPRNFDRRIEIVVPLKDRAVAHRVRYEILDTYLSDTLSARELLSSGRYRRLVPKPGEPGISSQSLLIDLAAAEHLDLPSRRSEQLAETR